MVSRTVTAIVTASMLTLQWTPKLAYAENQMGYRLLSVQEASRLPPNHGALGVDVERATQITDDGMTFDIIRVKQVRSGSAGAQAGFRRGDQIIAVDGRVFPSIATFAAYVGSNSPGSRVSIDYIPAGGGPEKAERVAVIIGGTGKAAQGLPQTPQSEEPASSGMSLEPRSASGRQPYWDAMRWAASPPDRSQPGLPETSSRSIPTEHSNDSTSPRAFLVNRVHALHRQETIE